MRSFLILAASGLALAGCNRSGADADRDVAPRAEARDEQPAVAAGAGTSPAMAAFAEFKWSPGYRDGLTEISILHLDRDSPVRQQIPAVGLGITAIRSAAPIS